MPFVTPRSLGCAIARLCCHKMGTALLALTKIIKSDDVFYGCVWLALGSAAWLSPGNECFLSLGTFFAVDQVSLLARLAQTKNFSRAPAGVLAARVPTPTHTHFHKCKRQKSSRHTARA